MKSKSVRPKLGSSVAKGGTPTLSAAEYRKLRQPHGKPWVRRSAGAERTVDGITFASRAEMVRYLQLKTERDNGGCFGMKFIRQPVFDLAGVRYTADFLVWTPLLSGGFDFRVEDVKGPGCHGEVLRRFKRNQKQVRELYGIAVVLVEVPS